LYVDEDIDQKTLCLLSDADLKDLGFSMGHRRLLCHWIAQQSSDKAISSGNSNNSTAVSSTGNSDYLEHRVITTIQITVQVNSRSVQGMLFSSTFYVHCCA